MVPDDLSKAIDYTRRAGDRALVQLAPDEALRWYTQALEPYDRHRGDERLHVALMIGLGTAQRQTGIPARRDTLLAAADKARSLGDTESLVAAVFANHRGFASVTGGIDTERLAQIDAALDAVGPDDSIQRARLLAIALLRPNRGATESRANPSKRARRCRAGPLATVTVRLWCRPFATVVGLARSRGEVGVP